MGRQCGGGAGVQPRFRTMLLLPWCSDGCHPADRHISLAFVLRCSGSVHGLAKTGEKYLGGGRMYVWQSLKVFYHYTSLPVLEEEGVTYFNGHKVNWNIRHIWGQFKALVW